MLVRSLMIQMRRPPRLPGDIKDSTMPANLQFRRGGLADRRRESQRIKWGTVWGMVTAAIFARRSGLERNRENG